MAKPNDNSRKRARGATTGINIPIEDAESKKASKESNGAPSASAAPSQPQASRNDATGATGATAGSGAGAGVTAPAEPAVRKAAGASPAAAERTGSSNQEKAAGSSTASGSGSDSDVVSAAEDVLADDAMEKAAAEINRLGAEVAEWKDKYLRLHAEWDTYRRRTSEQRSEERARANEKLVESMLPVLDDFDRTIGYAEENGEGGLLDGVKAVQSKLNDTLAKSGVVIINPEGAAFDMLEHQAVSTVEDASVPDETVTHVLQKGYKMSKKVLRAAMVTVATGGPARPKDSDGADVPSGEED